MFSNLRSLIFKLDPEIAHSLAIKSLKLNFVPNILNSNKDNDLFKTKLFNKDLANPIGVAAGFDKNAEVYNSLFNLGFGFVEVGTVTPLEQYGNPKPRVFRLVEDEALINRMGFNNLGAKNIADRILSNKQIGLLGINIGPNKDTNNRHNDYIECLKAFYRIADYITINISSPNTPGLRDLQSRQHFQELIKLIKAYKIDGLKTPILIKLSPDLTKKELEIIVNLSIDGGIDGLILSNTTIERKDIMNKKFINEEGGLSG